MTLTKKSKLIIILLAICSVLSTLLLSEINVLMNNIIILVLYIAIGGVAQYELINAIKQYNGTNLKEYKMYIILGSIVVWVIVLFIYSKYYRIL